MGYTTNFAGKFKFSQPLTPEQQSYLNTFSGTRRMKRDPKILQELYNGEFGFNGEYGVDGEYFAKDDGQYGQSSDSSIIEYNTPPGQLLFDRSKLTWDQYYALNELQIKEGKCQPGLWCHWISEDGSSLEWDGGEKFYNYVEWLQYLINHFFAACGVKLNGKVKWQGEDRRDRGTITVIDNEITVS